MLREKFKTTNLYNFINKKSKLAKLVTISVLLISLFVTGYVIAADKPTLSWVSVGIMSNRYRESCLVGDTIPVR